MRTLKFKKGSGKTDTVEFFANGQQVVVLNNPKQRITPHDMVHFVVEKCFPFEGFVRLVFEGHEPTNVMEVLGGIAPKLPSEYSQTSWITESLVEALQALLWSNSDSFDDFQYGYQKACEARKIIPEPINQEQFGLCIELASNLSARWQALSDGDDLELNL